MKRKNSGQEGLERFKSDGVRYTKESQRCGKKDCKSCPHGAYFHAYLLPELAHQLLGDELKFEYRRKNSGGRIREIDIYIGKDFYRIGDPVFNEIRRQRRRDRKERAARKALLG